MERSQTIRGNLKNRTADEAYRLGISEDKLIELANAGIIPGTKLGPRTWVFDPDEVDAALLEIRKKQKEVVA
jgi:hypothetical protein